MNNKFIMPKLYFRYGTMNSSKTSNLLMVAHNYQALNRKILLMKPKIDTRTIGNIKSRIGFEKDVDILIDLETDLLEIDYQNFDCVIIDEVQFLLPKHIDQLRIITKYVPVICYGLRTDYRIKMFSGSQRLMELADTIEEIKTICVDCSHKAIINAKYIQENNKITLIKDGSDKTDLGAEEKYRAMCWDCWSK